MSGNYCLSMALIAASFSAFLSLGSILRLRSRLTGYAFALVPEAYSHKSSVLYLATYSAFNESLAKFYLTSTYKLSFWFALITFIKDGDIKLTAIEVKYCLRCRGAVELN